jgi:thiosulfate dehydrogenase [quinone] large subunit
MNYNPWQQFVLVLIRFAVGWHLFYQGLGKFRAVAWTSKGYLDGARGPFSSWFEWMVESPGLVQFADTLTVWSLMILGLLLMLGLFTRCSALAAMGLILLFFLAAPPVTMMGFSVPTAQGYELYVDKNLIEILALLVVVSFPTGQMAGLDILVSRYWRRRRNTAFKAG